MGRTKVGHLAVALMLGAIAALPVAAATPHASADAGHPGDPHDPETIFLEPFETVPDRSVATFLDEFTGADGIQYTAHPDWIDGTACNGIIGSANIGITIEPPDSGQLCDDSPYDGWVIDMAQAIGDVSGGGADNMVLASTSVSGSATPSGTFLETVGTIPLDSANRFLGFELDSAGMSCELAHPQLEFYLVDGDSELRVNDDFIDPCVGGAPIPNVSNSQVGHYSTDAAFLFDGTDVGIRLYNSQANSLGNDFAIDNIRLVDATPQLDVAFGQEEVTAGDAATLQYWITNTSELGAKAGWSFSASLPGGLVVADAPNVESDCDSITTSEPAPGQDSFELGADLGEGVTSCSVQFDVLVPADAADGTQYTTEADDVTVVGLRLPGSATLTATQPTQESTTTTTPSDQGALPRTGDDPDVTTWLGAGLLATGAVFIWLSMRMPRGAHLDPWDRMPRWLAPRRDR